MFVIISAQHGYFDILTNAIICTSFLLRKQRAVSHLFYYFPFYHLPFFLYGIDTDENLLEIGIVYGLEEVGLVGPAFFGRADLLLGIVLCMEI